MAPKSAVRGAWMIIIVTVLGAARPTCAYRPYDSTDAAVADPAEVELEFGYFNVQRTSGDVAFATPQIVLNLGVVPDVEVTGQLEVQEPVHGNVQIVDPEILAKAVLKEGVLQDRDGVSIALELGALLPSDIPQQGGAGFSAIGIVSGLVGPVLLHVNAGGGMSRDDQAPLGIWGVIAELPIASHLRLGSEVDGQSVDSHTAQASGLLGLIWDSKEIPLALDVAVRRGFTSATTDWALTVGFTYGLSLAHSELSPVLQ